MANILCIESATEICSVAIFNNTSLLSIKESSRARSHTELITVFIRDCLQEADLQMQDLDAVAVSSGPGSYTSLRIGVSTAKGICFGQNLPLIAIDTLHAMAYGAEKFMKQDKDVIATIDARRMEAYIAKFDFDFNRLNEDRPQIFENDFLNQLENDVIIVGNAVEKAKEIFQKHSIESYHFIASARNMASLARQKYEAKDFEDLAYYVPNYIKPVRIIKSKKKLL